MATLSYEMLAQPLPIWHPKAWYYGIFRLGLKTIGTLSDGVRLGFEYGFDSGVMLEYVYCNRPHGITPLGTLIDWVYLNSKGWRGIRQRSQLLQQTLRQVLQSYAGQPCHLLDVACGSGRYDLEVLKDFANVSATLHDYKPENVEKARQLAEQLKIAARIERADAFSDRALQQVNPTVIVVSGLHEIVPDDTLIKQHFQQLYNIMQPGGKLIFTIQPQHPQLELIARVLPSHTGRPWVMRLRSWDLTRHWAETAGFRNFQVQMEPNQIFGVVTAEK